MPVISVTVVGNLVGDPELRFTPNGSPVATFTVASNERYRDESGQWKDGAVSFVRCVAWRDLAEHAAESLTKGERVIVTGTLRQRDYEATDGSKRTVWEVAASEVGAALSYATVKIARARRDSVPLPEDPRSPAGRPASSARASSGPAAPADYPDEPPF